MALPLNGETAYADTAQAFSDLPSEQQVELEKTMVLIELKKGESVAFDSYEPHMAATNTTNTPRFAMKIAYADGAATNGTHRYMMQTSTLENY